MENEILVIVDRGFARIVWALLQRLMPRPAMLAPRLCEGLSVCRDHRRDGSINGTFASGRCVAREVVLDPLEMRR